MVFLRYDLVTYFLTFVTYRPGQNIADRDFGPISIIVQNMNQIKWFRKYELLENFKVNVDVDAGGSA